MKKGSLIREAAFILVFTKIFQSDETPDEIVEIEKSENVFDLKLKDNEETKNGLLNEEDFDNLSVSLFKGVCDHEKELDEIISAYSDKRQIGRISKISLAVLRLALYEIKYNEMVPTNVAISEAVNLAKKFGLDSEVKFVNGVLGKYSRNEDKE